MEKETVTYQTPTVTELGDFTTLTLGFGHKGRDHSSFPRYRFHG